MFGKWRSRSIAGPLIGLLIGFTIISHQNCQRHSQSDEVRSPSNFRPATKQAKLLVVDTCQNAANYDCTQRFYRPGLTNSESYENICLNLGQQYCLNVHVLNYDSSQAIEHCANCTQADSSSGGRYNREESFCVNSKLTEVVGQETRSYADSLKAALADSISKCEIALN